LRIGFLATQFFSNQAFFTAALFTAAFFAGAFFAGAFFAAAFFRGGGGGGGGPSKIGVMLFGLRLVGAFFATIDELPLNLPQTVKAPCHRIRRRKRALATYPTTLLLPLPKHAGRQVLSLRTRSPVLKCL